MTGCGHKKRLEIYLDGWMESGEARRLEKHLKECSECQMELVELEEISSAALEIVDQAPESDYWSSFATRVNNRVISRQCERSDGPEFVPFESQRAAAKKNRLRIGAYSAALLTAAALLILLMRNSGREHSLAAPEIVRGLQGTDAGSMASGANIDKLRMPEAVSPVRLVTGDTRPERAVLPAVLRLEDDGAGRGYYSGLAEIVHSAPGIPDLRTSFRGEKKVDLARLALNESEFQESFSWARDRATVGHFRINPEVVAEWIVRRMQETSGPRTTAGEKVDFLRGKWMAFGSALSVPGGEGISTRWGYSGIKDEADLPGDGTAAEDLGRYLIELDLMETR